ncbi:hypothetical protein ACFQPA_17605 [Halomarina halobia]|uniref:Uncharacterized protein n=1 Tax=Halomarina halobia TaxID=3033386 RepID=A0ABD6AD94_9EURY|nr:hypothetical protein [Halomarina sp. PSR21]
MTTRDGDDADSLLPYAGLGGVVVCCAVLELLGGAAILGGLAATIGLSTGLTYLAVTGVGGVTAVLLLLGYRQSGRTSGA